MSDPHDTRDQRAAARTTIVGGQPPGNVGAYHEVPIGMERLLGLAAVDDRLAEELERDPVGLADGCGIALEPTEKAVLAATTTDALRRMLGGIRAGLAQPDRREFMKRASVAVAALAAGSAAAAGGCRETTPKAGTPRPTRPPDMSTQPPDMVPVPEPVPEPEPEPDAGVPVRRPPRYMDQIKRAVSPRRPRPRHPVSTKTGIRPKQ